ncbi:MULTISPECIES: hypothetical protein [unclassified Streptomyces]|nr:hypothetical protein [Streptomyces sp. DSM 41633]
MAITGGGHENEICPDERPVAPERHHASAEPPSAAHLPLPAGQRLHAVEG